MEMPNGSFKLERILILGRFEQFEEVPEDSAGHPRGKCPLQNTPILFK